MHYGMLITMELSSCPWDMLMMCNIFIITSYPARTCCRKPPGQVDDVQMTFPISRPSGVGVIITGHFKTIIMRRQL